MNFLAEAGSTAVSGSWIIDVIFFALLLIGLIGGAAQGFFRGISKLAGTLFSVLVAFLFCVQVSASFEDAFGLTTSIANAVHSPTVAYWLSVILCFIGLFVCVKLGAFLIGTLGKAIVDSARPLRAVDKTLGALLGCLKAFFLITLILLFFKWLQIDAVEEFLHGTAVVGGLYYSGWLEWVAAYAMKFLHAAL